jgi:hypothetical protein
MVGSYRSFLFEALKRLRNTSDVDDDIHEMRVEERLQSQEAQITMWELVVSKSLRMPLVIAIVMQLSQQLSGINAASISLYFHPFRQSCPFHYNRVVQSPQTQVTNVNVQKKKKKKFRDAV